MTHLFERQIFPPSIAFPLSHWTSIHCGKTLLKKAVFNKNSFKAEKSVRKLSVSKCYNTKSFTNKNCTGIKIQNVQITTGFLIIVIRIRAYVLVSCLFHC